VGETFSRAPKGSGQFFGRLAAALGIEESLAMFSGIVEALGTVVELRDEPPGCRLIVREPKIAAETRVADSISVNGCCLTVIDCQGETFAFQAGPETLARTNLGELKPGSPVNLERALAVGDRLGGHFVSGHIDGVGKLLRRDDSGEWSTFWISVPRELAVQMASKGSIAVDGVSLTIVESDPTQFSIALIPYTLAVTSLGRLQVGGRVNLETDILAKYVQRLVEAKDWGREKC
jgi:riboflavin synthase